MNFFRFNPAKFLVALIVAVTSTSALSGEHQAYRIDKKLMQLTFSDMIVKGLVQVPSQDDQPSVKGRERKRSAAYYIQAREAQNAQRYSDAVQLYQQAVEQDPENIAAWEELGNLDYIMGLHVQAIDAWNRVLAHEEDVDLLFKCGLLESELGLHDRASEHLLRLRLLLDESLPLIPEIIVQNAILAQSLRKIHNIELVLALEEEIESMLIELALVAGSDAKAGQRWMRLIHDLFNTGDLKTARLAARIRLEYGALEGTHGPWIASILKMRYVLLDAILDGNGQSTIDLFEQLSERGLLRSIPPDWRKDVTHAQILYEAARDYSTLSNKSGANRLFAEVLIHDPDHVLARNNLGYSALEDGPVTRIDIGLIESSLHDAREQDHESLPAVLDTMGWLRYMQRHFEDDEHARGAISYLQEAIEHTELPDPILLDHLGDAQWLAGHRDEAVNVWMEALRRLNDPNFKERYLSTHNYLQGRLWQFHIVDSRDLYDQQYGKLQERLIEKLSAVELGNQPPVAERRRFIP